MKKIKDLKKSKGALATQSLFAILMLVLFVAIIVYGYNALMGAQDVINDEELKKLRVEFVQKTSVCAQGSQSGRVDTLEVDTKGITHICYIRNLDEIDNSIVFQLESKGIFQDSTVVLLNGPRNVDFSGFSDMSQIDEFVIYDIIPLDDNVILKNLNNSCVVEEGGVIEFQFEC